MSNELVRQSNQAPSMNMQEMQTMAKLFAESGMFPNVNSMAKAFIKIQAGIELGIAPFASMSGIHIIKEKATVGAGLMAGKIKSSGKYDYKVVQLSNEVCELDFYEGGKKVGTETFTIADAKKAGTQNLEKFAKNMLFARAISNGMKFYCPDLYTMPVYTPEEMNTNIVTEDIQHEEMPQTPLPALPTKEQVDAAINKINAATSIDNLKEIYTGLSKELQAATIAEKDAMKNKLTPPPLAWSLTQELQTNAQALINNSTLDADGITRAATAVATCTTQDGYDAIIAHLKTMQKTA